MSEKAKRAAGMGGCGVLLAAAGVVLPCGLVLGNCSAHQRNVSDAEIVHEAIERAAVHPTVVEVLGTPQTVHTWVARDMDLEYWSGGTSTMTSFWRPGVTRKRIDLLTTIDGPKGSAFFSVSGEQTLADGSWHSVRMSAFGTDIGDVASFTVDLTKPEDPGTIVRVVEAP